MTVSTDKTVSIVASKNLVKALKTAAGITSPYSLTALQHLHLKFFGDDLTVESTSFDLYFRQTVFIPELGVQEPFSVMVHRDTVKTLKPGMDVAFGESSYTFGGIKYTSACVPADFPKFPELSAKNGGLTTSSDYFTELDACAISASDSEVRPVLTGVCHRGSTLIATDGLRLGSSLLSCEFPKDFILPSWPASLLRKVFGKSSAYLVYDDLYVQYRGNGYQIMIRQIEGTYPDVSRIMPSMFKTTVTVRGVDHWITALDRAITVHKQIPKRDRDESYIVRLEFDQSGIVLSVRNREQSEYNAPLPGDVSERPLTIACNAQYLKDALGQVGDGAEIQLSSPDKPFVLKSSPDKSYGFTALVSPIKVKQ